MTKHAVSSMEGSIGPAAIVRVANPRDVARGIEHARQTGVELAIRDGGHNPVGHSVSDGGIVLDPD